MSDVWFAKTSLFRRVYFIINESLWWRELAKNYMKETLRDEREREGRRKIGRGKRGMEQKIDGTGRESKEQKREDEMGNGREER